MRSLDEILRQATDEGWAVPHFNFTTLEQLKAIVETCSRLHSPVMAGTSEGERDFVGLKQALALVHSYREEGLPVFLNADHSYSVDKAREAIDAGYESVHIDLSKRPFAENVTGTKEIVEYARASGRSVSVEGEVGYIVTDSSRVYKKVIKIDPASFTKPDEARQFVEETGVDRFAPAVGNLHGIAANEPHLDFELIKKLRSSLPRNVSFVLHGGSGISDEEFKKAIASGIANVHISTEIRREWRQKLASSLKAQADEYAPYRLLRPVVEGMVAVIEHKILVFGSTGRVK